MKKYLSTFIIGMLILCSTTAYAYESHYGETGVIYYDDNQAYEGYTLFA